MTLNAKNVKYYTNYTITNLEYRVTPRGKIKIFGDLLDAEGQPLVSASLDFIMARLSEIATIQEK